MDFQLLNVVLEDRYPDGVGSDVRIPDDFLEEDFVEHVPRVKHIDKSEPGAIAFLFGRNVAGESVCVRVEGFFPKLYFALGAGDSALAMQKELSNEVRRELASSELRFKRCDFAHDYGYEPDASSPSGRRVHPYVEVAYPSLRSWRRAVGIRREWDIKQTRIRLSQVKKQIAILEERVLLVKQRCMTGEERRGQVHTEMERELQVAKEETYPSLRERLLSLLPDDGVAEEEESGGREEEEASWEAAASREPRMAHEYFVEPYTRFLHENKLKPNRWIRAPAHYPEWRVTSCTHELCGTVRDDFSRLAEAHDLPATQVTLYYDIETLALDPDKDMVIQVSMVFEWSNQRHEKHLVALKRVAPLADTVVHCCNTEADVLRTFRRLMIEKDPDNVVAYNAVSFDARYLNVRAQAGRAQEETVHEFFYLSRFLFRSSKLRELKLSSSGMGDNLLRFFEMPGRANFDWYVKLKRDLTSEPSYKLNHFAKKFCGDQKEDMDYKEIPVLQNGSDEDRARLGSYCVQDSDILRKLNKAREMLLEIMQFAEVFGIIPEWVYFRGQQVRFIAQLLDEARTKEAVPLLLNKPREGFQCIGKTYEGATVVDPTAGFHRRVAVLDWMSLYPSIMLDNNLCHSTFVTDPSLFDEEGVVEFRISDDMSFHFVSKERHEGVLTSILARLLSERKKAKGEVKRYKAMSKDEGLSQQERDKYALLAKVADGKQLALKVGCNSVYGACAASVDSGGKFPLQAISAVTTFCGRRAMEIKRRILPERFPDVEVIYGDTDSVMLLFHGTTTVQECADRSLEAATYVTDYFAAELGQHRMIMEFEKIYDPYLLEGKKRYAGLKFEPGDDNQMVEKGIDCKGIETERRDTLPFTKEVMQEVLNSLLYQRDVHLALRIFHEKMQLMIDDKVPFEQYVMKKNLSSKVEGKTSSVAQAKVNALRRQREPGSEEQVGNQVEFVFVNGHIKSKTTELAEDPTYAREKGLEINRLWYYNHTVKEPLGKLFKVFDTVCFEVESKKVERKLNAKRLNVASGAISSLMQQAGTSASVSASASAVHSLPRFPPPSPPRPAPARKKTKKEDAPPPRPSQLPPWMQKRE